MKQLAFVEATEIKQESRNVVLERIGQYGVKSLMNFEAVSIITGIKEEDLKQFGSLEDLKNRYQLLKMTKTQQMKIETFFELALRFNTETRSEIRKIKNPDDIFSINKEMRFLKKEEFRILILNTKHEVLKSYTVSVGSLNASIVHPREVFKEAILNSASAIVLVHNHPSGDPSPSKEDIAITKRLFDAGQLIGISVLDHVIIGDNVFHSMRENNDTSF